MNTYFDKISKFLVQNPGVRTWLLFIPLILLPVLLYSRIASFPLSNIDDPTITTNIQTILDSGGSFSDAFRTDAFGGFNGDSFYRPIQTLSLMIDTILFGKGPGGYHLSSLILHILTVLLLFVFMQRLKISTGVSFMVAAVFSVHPIFTHAVCWIPARGDMLIGFFGILIFLTFIEYWRTGKRSYFILHCFSFVLAMLSKETAIIFAPLLIIYFFFLMPKGKGIRFLFPFFGIWAFAFGLYMYLRSSVIKFISTESDFSFSAFIRNLVAIPTYLGKLFLPYNLSPLPAYRASAVIIGIVFIVLILFLVIKSSRVNKQVMWFWLLFFLGFTIPPLVFKLKAAAFFFDYLESRVYLPLIGIVVFIAFLTDAYLKNISRQIIYPVFLIVIAVCFKISWSYSSNYSDPIKVFDLVIKLNPRNAVAYNGRAITYLNMSNWDAMEADLDSAISIAPNMGAPYENMGMLFAHKGEHAKAAEYYRKSLQNDPESYITPIDWTEVTLKMGKEFMFAGKFPDALAVLIPLVKIYKESAVVYNYIGLAYSGKHQYDSAAFAYTNAIRIKPKYALSYTNRSIAYYKSGNYDAAISDCSKSISLKSRELLPYDNRALCYIETGKFDLALKDLQIAQKIDTNYALVYVHFAKLYNLTGEKAKARENEETAKRLGYEESDYKDL